VPSRGSRLPARRIAWNPIASWLPGKRHQRTLGTGPAGHASEGRGFPVSAPSPGNRHAQASHPDRRISLGVFGVTSGQALAGVVGPLIEVPVMLGFVYVALWARRRFYPAEEDAP